MGIEPTTSKTSDFHTVCCLTTQTQRTKSCTDKFAFTCLIQDYTLLQQHIEDSKPYCASFLKWYIYMDNIQSDSSNQFDWNVLPSFEGVSSNPILVESCFTFMVCIISVIDLSGWPWFLCYFMT